MCSQDGVLYIWTWESLTQPEMEYRGCCQTWDWFSGKPRQHSLSLFVLIMPSEKILWTDGVALILVA